MSRSPGAKPSLDHNIVTPILAKKGGAEVGADQATVTANKTSFATDERVERRLTRDAYQSTNGHD